MMIKNRVKELRKVRASELKPSAKNWRTHPKAQQDALRGVLAEIGFADAVLARELVDGTLELIDGHLRAETVGDTEVPVLVLDVNEEEAGKLLATLDPLAAMAGADPAKLDELLKQVSFDSDAVAEMLKGMAQAAGLAVAGGTPVMQDEIPEPPAADRAVTRRGDLWLLLPPPPSSPPSSPSNSSNSKASARARSASTSGTRGDGVHGGSKHSPDSSAAGREAGVAGSPSPAVDAGHRVLCGDSTDPHDVKLVMDGKRASLFATDPPYLVGYDGTNHPQSFTGGGSKDWSDSYGTTWDDADGNTDLYDKFVSAAIAEALEPNAAWYCWHASRRQAMLESVWNKHGAFVHCQIVWGKNRPVLTRTWFMWQHEPCLMGWIKGKKPPKGPEATPMSTLWSIDTIPNGDERPDHPTPKPLEVFAIPMRQHLTRGLRGGGSGGGTRGGGGGGGGGICYEPFCGSGSQVIAAEQLERRCFAIEIEPRYVDVTLERWIKLTGRQPVLAATGQTFEQVRKARLGKKPPTATAPTPTTPTPTTPTASTTASSALAASEPTGPAVAALPASHRGTSKASTTAGGGMPAAKPRRSRKKASTTTAVKSES
ncbi:MAG: hypothetical protein AMXMBFR58_11440 [Phycisphaerae bacterium]